MREEGGQRHLSLLKPHFSFSHDPSKAMAVALSVHARLPPQSSHNESEVPHGKNRQQFLKHLLCARHCVGKDHSSAQEAKVPVL